MSELNIQSNICKLMLEALNKHRSKLAAARSLEVTTEKLNGLIRRNNIIKVKNKYESKSNASA